MLLEILISGGLRVLLAALALVVITVAIHAVGLSMLVRALARWEILAVSGLRRVTAVLIVLTCWLMLIHLLEISVWGLFYLWEGCMPDAETAFYFSGETYTTLGYGDLVLPKAWRMLAPLEAMTGILVSGLSTGVFFAIVLRWISNWMRARITPEPAPPSPTSD